MKTTVGQLRRVIREVVEETARAEWEAALKAAEEDAHAKYMSYHSADSFPSARAEASEREEMEAAKKRLADLKAQGVQKGWTSASPATAPKKVDPVVLKVDSELASRYWLKLMSGKPAADQEALAAAWDEARVSARAWGRDEAGKSKGEVIADVTASLGLKGHEALALSDAVNALWKAGRSSVTSDDLLAALAS